MSQDFEKWLTINQKRDESTIKGKKIVDKIRQTLKDKLVEHFQRTEDQTWCKCDVCTIIRLKAEDEKIIDSLAYVGLEYLLGENFNAVAALSYYSYFRCKE